MADPMTDAEIAELRAGLAKGWCPFNGEEANATIRALLARLDAAEAEIAGLKVSVIAFGAPAAVRYAEMFGLDGLHPKHFDMLEAAGGRMSSFKRAVIAKAGG